MKTIKPTNADSSRVRRKTIARKVTIESSVPSAVPSASTVHVATLRFPPQPIPPPTPQAYASPVQPTLLPQPAPVASPSAPSSYTPPVAWNTSTMATPPPMDCLTPVAPPVQHAPSHHASPPPTHPNTTPTAPPLVASPPIAAVNAPYGGVSFAPISTPAMEAISAENPTTYTKRKKPTRPVASAIPPPIHCRACKLTDIPLLMGGRICRRCLEGGRLSEAIPELYAPSTQPEQSSSSSSATPALEFAYYQYRP
ncbi:hypothetical protein BC835DRAFT_753691 [Cytidiella melzeri]|nr:hypothetical protein BC835DRAFT_753691 [Cytidiella melzeri]